MAVTLIAWSTTYPLPGHVLKSQIQSVSQTLSRLSLKATIFCADAISDGEAKSGLELPSIRPPQLAPLSFQTRRAMSPIGTLRHSARRIIFGRSWSNSRQRSARRLKSYAAIDPERPSGLMRRKFGTPFVSDQMSNARPIATPNT